MKALSSLFNIYYFNRYIDLFISFLLERGKGASNKKLVLRLVQEKWTTIINKAALWLSATPTPVLQKITIYTPQDKNSKFNSKLQNGCVYGWLF